MKMQSKKKSMSVRIVKINEIKSMAKRLIEKADDTLCLGNNDQVMLILRYFRWNIEKMESKWFEMDGDPVNKMHLLGIEYDEKLVEKHPDINDTRPAKNENTCKICYCEFEPDDEEMKADSLSCGHQFSAICWRMYLQDKIKSDGPACVYTKCA